MKMASAHTYIVQFLLCVLTFVYAPWIAAQELEIPISPSRVGSGARAAGMADAFVAIADDATAASWNPAGLVQLERPEISLVGQFNALSERFSSVGHPEFDSTQRDGNLDLNFASITYPLPFLLFGRNATVSLSHQLQYDLSRRFKTSFDTQETLDTGALLTRMRDLSFNQDGALNTISPAFAIEITHRVSVGAAINLWRDSPFEKSEWTQQFSVHFATSLDDETPVLTERTTREKYQNVTGENVTLGVLWRATSHWNFGFRYDSPLEAHADFFSQTTVNGAPLNEPVRERRTIRLPSTFAVGAAFRPNDRFTAAFDISYTDWNDFYVQDAKGNRFSLVDASNIDDPETATDFEPTVTARLGFEYVFIPQRPRENLPYLWTVRWGTFFDQEPATGKGSTELNVPGSGEPDDFYGISLGVGLLAQNRVNIDVAYQFRYGNDVNRDFFRNISGFHEDVFQHRVLLSTVIYF